MIREHWQSAAWWRDLQPDPEKKRRGDRAALARLRRCASAAAAMGEEATIELFRRVGATGPGDLPDVALAAAVLAHVREDRADVSVARAIGPATPDKPETAILKPLRFRRLMEASDPDERLIAFRRLVALAGGELPVGDLAAALLNWTEHRRQRWTYEYWDAGQPASLASAPAKDPAV